MRRLRMFLAPLALLLLIAAAIAATASAGAAATTEPLTMQPPARAGWREPVWRQVSILQRWTVRIIPGTASMPPSVVEEIQEEERIEHVEVHKIGKCLAVGNIAAEQPGDSNELLLFLHDQRIISAMLDKRCSARNFYAGFYLVPNADGAICSGRDTLHSRSGFNCKLRRLSELVPIGFRRFP